MAKLGHPRVNNEAKKKPLREGLLSKIYLKAFISPLASLFL